MRHDALLDDAMGAGDQLHRLLAAGVVERIGNGPQWSSELEQSVLMAKLARKSVGQKMASLSATRGRARAAH